MMPFKQRWSGLFRQVLESSIPEIPVEHRPVLVANIDAQPVNFGIDVAVDKQQILPAVVVEIKEAATPAYKAGVVSHSGTLRRIVKLALAAVSVQSFAFVRKIASKQVKSAIAVIVT